MFLYPWWRHQMETFSAVLAICAENSPSPANSPHKGQWPGALMFSLIWAWINYREADDWRRHRAHYDVIVMHCSDCIITSKPKLCDPDTNSHICKWGWNKQKRQNIQHGRSAFLRVSCDGFHRISTRQTDWCLHFRLKVAILNVILFNIWVNRIIWIDFIPCVLDKGPLSQAATSVGTGRPPWSISGDMSQSLTGTERLKQSWSGYPPIQIENHEKTLNILQWMNVMIWSDCNDLVP